MDKLTQLISSLGWPVQDISLYRQALTHSSYAHEHGEATPHNERLEFLGDAVLELVISDYLYHRYPDLPEGHLTRMRASIVCEPSLAKLAREMGLGEAVRLGRGEKASGGRSRPALLADLVEAMIGALFLQAGFETANRLVLELFSKQLNSLGREDFDYKTKLQESVQALLCVTPKYEIVSASGPDHNKNFTAQVMVNGEVLGSGSGRSKKDAEQAAAREGLQKLSLYWHKQE